MKTIKWNGHVIDYNPENLVPLMARVATITRNEFINKVEAEFTSEEFLYGDWLKFIAKFK